MLLKVHPVGSFQGKCCVPSSKPETQRAILIASLSEGISKIYNDLRCKETDVMKKACSSIGTKIIEHADHLEIHGIGNKLDAIKKVIQCEGSGLVFRTFAVLTSVSKTPAVITGDKILCRRIMGPLFSAMKQLGSNFECISRQDCAPIVNWGNSFKGGYCTVPGNLSSQFITALLIAAPYAEKAVEITITDEIISKPYILQTIATMKNAGIELTVSPSLDHIMVKPGHYQAINTYISGDYTSASYILAAAALFKGELIVKNMNSQSLQGEKAIIEILQIMGIEIRFNDAENQLVIINRTGILKGNYEFNVIDSPNILPTLAAIGAYVEGTFRVVGGAVTQLHKSPRIEAMINELAKMGVDIKPIMKQEIYDGFEIQGKSSYSGNVKFSSWNDHRIFMSLFVTSLRASHPNYLAGYEDVDCSFPGFFEEFSQLGVEFNPVEIECPDYQIVSDEPGLKTEAVLFS